MPKGERKRTYEPVYEGSNEEIQIRLPHEVEEESLKAFRARGFDVGTDADYERPDDFFTLILRPLRDPLGILPPLPPPPFIESILKDVRKRDWILNDLEQGRWTRESNYGGRQFDQYIKGPGKTRDSGPLEESNFDAALEMLGGEDVNEDDPDSGYYGDVIVVHSNHWAVGWTEQIMVHEDAREKLLILTDIKKKLEDYPVLDESDFSQRETEGQEESYDNWARKTVIGWLESHLNIEDLDLDDLLDENPKLEAMLKREVVDEMSYHGSEDHYIDQKHFMSDIKKSDLYQGIIKAMKRSSGNGFKTVPNNSGKTLRKDDFVVYDGEIYTVDSIQGRNLILDFYNGVEEMEDLPIKANLGFKRSSGKDYPQKCTCGETAYPTGEGNKYECKECGNIWRPKY